VLFRSFRLPENFRFPFTAMNVADFWRRWHITLYSFMRDYLYIGLGGSRAGTLRVMFNVVFTMTLVGLWHGANWQFVAWGFYNGLLIVGYRILLIPIKKIPALDRGLDTVAGKAVRIALSNVLFFIGLAIFRCLNVGISMKTVFRMLTFDGEGERIVDPWVLLFFGGVLLSNLACEFKLPSRIAARIPLPLKYVGYALLIVVLVVFGPKNTQAFVYFQF